MCIAAAPALMSERVVRETLKALEPKPRQVADVGDAAHVDEHVLQPGDAQVRHAQRTRGDPAA